MSSFDLGAGGVNFNPTSGAGVLGTSQAKYGDNQFLALVTAQLANQTPLQPVDNDSFTQQLAMYSSIEQQTELNDNLLNLLDFQGLLARLQGLNEGSSLLGKDVSWMKGNLETSGVVKSVFVDENGNVQLKTEEGNLDLREVMSISDPQPAADSKDGGDSGETKADA